MAISLLLTGYAQGQQLLSEVQVSNATNQAVLEVVKTWHDTPIVGATPTPGSPPSPTPTLIPGLESINDWHYQLQNISLEQLKDSAYDLLVIDHADDDGVAFYRSRIDALSTQSNPKTVLAYMSIGEAEDYRFYWKSDWTTGNPSFIDEENPNWAGNYAVRYWLPGWGEIIADGSTNYLTTVINQGFDGVYLDKLDEYEYFENKVNMDATFEAQYGSLDFRAEMVALVKHIADKAHSIDPEFLIVVQNGLPLWHEAGFEGTIDAVAAEEVYFLDTGEVRPEEEVKELEGYLRLFRRSGKLVLTVDYLEASETLKISDAYEQARSAENDFVPFVTGVQLDEFRVNTGQEPD